MCFVVHYKLLWELDRQSQSLVSRTSAGAPAAASPQSQTSSTFNISSVCLLADFSATLDKFQVRSFGAKIYKGCNNRSYGYWQNCTWDTYWRRYQLFLALKSSSSQQTTPLEPWAPLGVQTDTVKTVLICLLPVQWHSQKKRCASAPVMPAHSGRKLVAHYCFFPPTLVRRSETEQLDICEKNNLSFSFNVASSVLITQI